MMNIKDPKLFSEIKRFLTDYLPRVRARSPHTIQAYKDSINLFMRFLKTCKQLEFSQISSTDFNQENIVEFLEWLRTDRSCGDSTLNQRLVNIRAFCKYLFNDNIIAFDNYIRVKEIELIKTADRILKEILTIEQMGLLLRLQDKTKRLGLRDHFYIALLYDSGCRNDEILSMSYGDFSIHKDGSADVKIIGKGRKYRVTPISCDVTEIFNQYAEAFHPERAPQRSLFYTTHGTAATKMSSDNTARILQKYEDLAQREDLDIPHLHPHLFRHSRAMHLYQAGVPLSIVAEWLGHSHLETTLIYAYADTEMKRKALEKVQFANSSVFVDEVFKYKNDEEALKKLYGLA